MAGRALWPVRRTHCDGGARARLRAIRASAALIQACCAAAIVPSCFAPALTIVCGGRPRRRARAQLREYFDQYWGAEKMMLARWLQIGEPCASAEARNGSCAAADVVVVPSPAMHCFVRRGFSVRASQPWAPASSRAASRAAAPFRPLGARHLTATF